MASMPPVEPRLHTLRGEQFQKLFFFYEGVFTSCVCVCVCVCVHVCVCVCMCVCVCARKHVDAAKAGQSDLVCFSVGVL